MTTVPVGKLRPPNPRGAVEARVRLEAALDVARAQRRASLLIAPAGYGKSTVAACWARERAPGAAWLSLDPADDAGVRDRASGEALLAHLLEAALVAAGALEAPSDGMERPGDLRLPDLIARLERSSWRGVVVVDDAHVLGAWTAAALATWVERAPEGVHTVVLARAGGHLPIARLVVRDLVELFETQDLRLERPESRSLLLRVLPELDPELADRLHDRVEGWAAGLHLASRSLRGRADPHDVVERFTGTDRYVLAFLTEEVLLRLPDDLHEAVLLLALEPRVCAGLVDELTGRSGGAALLERLEAHEAFIERLDVHDEHAPWFRFPGFFRDLLAHRLASLPADVLEGVRLRSHAWWARSGGALRGAAPAATALPELTPREREVLGLLAGGATTKAMAKALEVSPNTVKTHTRHLFEKLGVRTRTEAAAVARDHGLG